LSIGEDESLHIIQCKICIKKDGKDKLLVLKWDSLHMHANCKKVNGNGV